uniref:C-type lectin domain-containing protein n=1 Tax=Monopterus albus TaxID=43700 RepID=A0A3Q3IR87_MONAL
MMPDYRDDSEQDSSALWIEGRPPASGVSRLKRWLFPALTAAAVLVLIIALGVSCEHTHSCFCPLWGLRCSGKTAEDVQQLQLAVQNNKDQLTSVVEALKQLSALDALSRSVAALKCSLEHIINNSSAAAGCCPMDWDLFSSSCYFFSKVSLSWEESRDWCEKQGSHLVVLSTDAEWDFVTHRTVSQTFWIGLTDGRTGKWEWVNQTPYVMERRRWRPGQPDNWSGHGLGPGDEDCAHLYKDGRLNDLHCSTRCATSARDTASAAEQRHLWPDCPVQNMFVSVVSTSELLSLIFILVLINSTYRPKLTLNVSH